MKRQRRRSVCVSFNHKTTGITSLPLPRAPCHSDWLEHLNLCLNVAFCCLLERLHVGSLAVSGEVILAKNIADCYCNSVCIALSALLSWFALNCRLWQGINLSCPSLDHGVAARLAGLLVQLVVDTTFLGLSRVDGKDYLCPSVIIKGPARRER